MILDYLFMGSMNMGIKGAALATGIGQLIPAVAGLVYFSCFHGSLHFVCPKFRFRVLIESCINGSSEMVTNLSTAVVTYLFNMTMLKFLGETGVAAITIVLYGQFLFTAMYMGFSMGVAPVISYNYGRDNRILLRRIFKICIGFISVSSVAITAIALLSTSFIVQIFTPVETETYAIAKDGFFLFSINYIFAGVNIFASSMFTAFSDGKTSAIISFIRTFTYAIAKDGFFLFSINYIFAGVNIFASSMFTAFSDGKTSAIISFIRTFVLLVLNILLLPVIMGVTGIWLAVPAAEFLTVFVSLLYFRKKRKTGIWLAVPAAEFLTVFVSLLYFRKKRNIYHYV